MNTPVNVMLFSNGNSAVFDKDGHQIPELQTPWLLMFVEFLEIHGFEPAGMTFEMPNGRVARLFRIDSESRYTWEIV